MSGGKSGAASATGTSAAGSASAEAAATEDAVPLRAGSVVVSRSTLVAEVPAGYAKMGADMPGLDDNARAHMAAGDIFLGNRQNQTLIASARAVATHAEDAASCKKLSSAMAQAMNGSLAGADVVVGGPAGKACRMDIRLGGESARDATLARSFVFRVNAQMQAVVLCIPFAAGTASDAACSQFVASVRAK